MTAPRDAVVTGSWAVVSGASVLLLSPGPVRLLLVAPLVLFLPGHALRRALRLAGDNATERVTLDVGLSLAAAALTGLVLDLTRPGLQAVTWAPALVGVTLVAVLVDVLRDRRVTVGARPRAAQTAVARLNQLGAARMLMPMVAAAVVVGSVSFSIASAQRAQARTSFTQLSVAAQDGRAELAVHNFEGSAVRYALTVTVRGRPLAELGELVVPAGEERRVSYDLPPTTSAARFRFELRREGIPDVYRQVTIATDATDATAEFEPAS